VVTRTRRKLAVAHRPQLAAERLLRDGDRELVQHPLAKIDDPPANHAVHGWDWTVFDHLCERGAMHVLEA
jgi:hypothetical protein